MADGFFNDEKTLYLITDRYMRRYFSGTDVAEGLMLVGTRKIYFTDARYFYAAKSAMPPDIDTRLYKSFDDVAAAIKECKAERVGLDYEHTTLYEYEKYKTSGVAFFDGTPDLTEKRYIKTEEEICYIKKACEIAEKAYYAAIKTLKTGITEKQVRDEIVRNIKKFGGEGEAFETIVAFGKNSAVPHHVTGDDVLSVNMPVLVDMGALYNGYCSDLTRTAFYGIPSEKFKTCFNAVLEANDAAEAKIAAGMKTFEADAISRGILKKYGIEEHFTHSLGHGVGLEIHEFPALSPRTDDILKDGAVFTIEPGVYFDGEFGIRTEDTVVMKGGKVERLFKDDKSLMIINPKNRTEPDTARFRA